MLERFVLTNKSAGSRCMFVVLISCILWSLLFILLFSENTPTYMGISRFQSGETESYNSEHDSRGVHSDIDSRVAMWDSPNQALAINSISTNYDKKKTASESPIEAFHGDSKYNTRQDERRVYTKTQVDTNQKVENSIENLQSQLLVARKALETLKQELVRSIQEVDKRAASRLDEHEEQQAISNQKRAQQLALATETGTFRRITDDAAVFPSLHLVFSTSCSERQAWLTESLLHSASRVGFSGKITRIVSGCNSTSSRTMNSADMQQKMVEAEEKVSRLKRMLHVYSPFYLHFTPDFSWDAESNTEYSPLNKPFGLQHWLEHANPPVADDIIAVVDPDFMMLRALKVNTHLHEISPDAREPLLYRGEIYPDNLSDKSSGDRKTISDVVSSGHAIAQAYLYGGLWKKWLKEIFADTEDDIEYVQKVFESDEKSRELSIGPPYIAIAQDFRKLVDDYGIFSQRAWRYDRGWISEMYGYSLAAARQGIDHLRLEHFMISSPDAWDEGWPFIDSLPSSVNPCSSDIYLNISQSPLSSRPILPTFLHMCQNYVLKDWRFYKYEIPENILECSMPMLAEPPPSLWDDLFSPESNMTEGEKLKSKRLAFTICTAIKGMNAMLKDYKTIACKRSQFNATKAYRIAV